MTRGKEGESLGNAIRRTTRAAQESKALSLARFSWAHLNGVVALCNGYVIDGRRPCYVQGFWGFLFWHAVSMCFRDVECAPCNF